MRLSDRPSAVQGRTKRRPVIRGVGRGVAAARGSVRGCGRNAGTGRVGRGGRPGFLPGPAGGGALPDRAGIGTSRRLRAPAGAAHRGLGAQVPRERTLRVVLGVIGRGGELPERMDSPFPAPGRPAADGPPIRRRSGGGRSGAPRHAMRTAGVPRVPRRAGAGLGGRRSRSDPPSRPAPGPSETFRPGDGRGPWGSRSSSSAVPGSVVERRVAACARSGRALSAGPHALVLGEPVTAGPRPCAIASRACRATSSGSSLSMVPSLVSPRSARRRRPASVGPGRNAVTPTSVSLAFSRGASAEDRANDSEALCTGWKGPGR